ncbi:cytochrome P450 monooxygenase 55A1 [Apiospora marii]|uniref:Cytochrome P450 monooxygenase 55A1 n=1 Tax=Apiospora marii TaxID=335849 RepID=A0ABR1S000_9PEZI
MKSIYTVTDKQHRPPQLPVRPGRDVPPPSIYTRLRQEAPVSQVRLFDGQIAWLLTRHRDCCDALASPKLSADRRAPGYPEIHAGGRKARDAVPTFVNMDDPDHAAQRAMLEDDFAPGTVERKWRPVMEEVVDAVLGEFVVKGREAAEKRQEPVDLVREFAVHVPTLIIYRVLGVPAADVERLSRDSEIRNSTSRNAAETANLELQKYIAGLVKQKMQDQEPGDDIISKLVEEQLKPGHLTEDQVATLAFLVLTAGNAALINSIALGVLTLLQHPDQLADFKQQPEKLAARVVNEVTRYHTASGLNSRRAVKEDLVIGGQLLKRGEGVICAVQAANRDGDKFPDPDRFDIHRSGMRPEDTLGFGFGPHRCQAEYFSRAQLEVVFVKLFRRLPGLRLAKGEGSWCTRRLL